MTRLLEPNRSFFMSSVVIVFISGSSAPITIWHIFNHSSKLCLLFFIFGYKNTERESIIQSTPDYLWPDYPSLLTIRHHKTKEEYWKLKYTTSSVLVYSNYEHGKKGSHRNKVLLALKSKGWEFLPKPFPKSRTFSLSKFWLFYSRRNFTYLCIHK